MRADIARMAKRWQSQPTSRAWQTWVDVVEAAATRREEARLEHLRTLEIKRYEWAKKQLYAGYPDE
eukprot:COSAG01_NODE_113_length_25617_cov_10.523492_9_plen_66_part_00